MNKLTVLLAALISFNNSAIASQGFFIPSTISDQAATAAAQFSKQNRDYALPAATDNNGWHKVWEANEQAQKTNNEKVVAHFRSNVKHTQLGGVPVLDIKPRHWKDNGKVLVYTHGGAYTLFSARSTLISAAPVADATGLRVISIDYTVAPEGKWQETTDQVIAVIQALKNSGYQLKDMAIYGDSAGGGLAAGAVLKARDQGLGLIGAVVLWSPWSDITETGDSYHTLQQADPLLTYGQSLNHAANAYAKPQDQKHPYVSPVYADYSKGFPTTLIQVGTKEIFLSNAVRLYQALDNADIQVRIDPYEGMWHVFQAFHWQLPESYLAREKMADFLKEKLNY